MPIVIKAGDSPEEVLTVLAPVMHYFGATPSPQDATRFAPFIEPSRAFTAREDGAAVGGCASFPLELTVPGGVVRAAGLTIVGVLPTHRRRGVLRGMMRAQLDDVRRRNEPVATLWASEDTIYGQFGYGMASVSGDIDLAKSAVAFAQPIRSRGAFRILGEAEALAPLAEVYERVRLAQPGMIARGAEWWRNRRLADPENRRQGAGELNRVLLTLDGRPSGYALYRLRPQFEAGNSVGDLRVIEAIGATPEATREIWRFVLDVDWVARVKAFLLPVDHPLFFLLARPREMNFRVHDGLWIRLVDLPAAFAARRMGDAAPVVIEVTDAFCPWNAGRWQISGAGAERTSADAELDCDITSLGSVYLGGFSFRRLVRAGRVMELCEGAAERADTLFPADLAPWCPEIF
ncbi:MAG: GNAT family N-acetyltransferase [Candidatus Rokuibacteriota bacterium]|nr:MAG: GNAT family N-acetyltransferase [Candidatus Rokubacteria bacterium]